MRKIIYLTLALLMSGCASVALDSSHNDCWDTVVCQQGPVIEPSAAEQLVGLPYPNQKTVVAVYSFPDETGQRKPSETLSSFSTAVTQGAVHILIEALRDAGKGNWFAVVERSGLDNLSKERQLVRNTFESYSGKEASTILKPMLYAGMIMEGAIVGYDTNLRTGGSGARYLGIGMKNQYREDKVTVVLRAVLVQTGEVLLNVTATKTILSTAKGGDLFKFYEMGTTLVEAETGSTDNEPVSYAVRAAIEAAVYGLVMQGLEKEVWDFDYAQLREKNNEKDTD
tara:strand:- start:912 stop:1760 length:849 start_codon:yes stop_codon:yes gene_type:complete